MSDDQEFEIVVFTPATAYVNRTQNLNVKVTAATYEEAREALEDTLGELASKRVQLNRARKHGIEAIDHTSKRYMPYCQRCEGPVRFNSEGITVCPTCAPRGQDEAGTVAMLCQACKGPMQVNSDKIWACPTCNPDPCNSPP
jgi:hypothetical protein